MQHSIPAPSPLRETMSWFVWLILIFVLVPLSLSLVPPLAVLSGVIIIASLWMMQSFVGLFNLRQITMPGFFFFLYFASILVPGFFIFADEITPSRWRFLFGIESVLITVPIGILIANLVFTFSKREIIIYFRQPIATETLGASALGLYGLFIAVATIFVLFNLKETPVIPLFYLIHNPGEFLTAALLREDAFKLLQSHLTYVYFLLRGTVLPFLTLVAYGRYRQQQNKMWRRLFCISLIFGISYAALTIEKSPVATIFGMLFVFHYLYRGGRVGRGASIAAPLLFLSFPLIILLLAYHGSESGTVAGVIQGIAVRLFYSPAQIVYAYFEMFPSIIPFQHGASIAKLAGLFGWKAIDIPNAVGLYMTSGTDLDTISANGCFIGNLNADFGLPGVVIGGIADGFLMQAVSLHFCRRPKTVVDLAAHTICRRAFGLMVTNPLPATLLSGGVFFALLLAWIFLRSSGISVGAHAGSSPTLADGAL